MIRTQELEDNELRWEYLEALGKSINRLFCICKFSSLYAPNLEITIVPWNAATKENPAKYGMQVKLLRKVEYAGWYDDCILHIPFNLKLIADIFDTRAVLEDILNYYHFTSRIINDESTNTKLKYLVKPLYQTYESHNDAVTQETLEAYQNRISAYAPLFDLVNPVIEPLMYNSEEERVRKNRLVKFGILKYTVEARKESVK